MKILVLGGTGAMGVPVVQILAQRNNEVYVTTRHNRESQNMMIHYFVGNAKDKEFISELLKKQYDAIIDFMIYTPEEFQDRVQLFLKKSKQYLFISSARVYSDGGAEKISETLPRLLEVIDDEEYLKTNEYALAKAREENELLKSAYKNWTIIRPYITYNNERLQLGVLEKEYWLKRALSGKKIVFSKDIASRYTTLTYGYDVSLRIADLVGKSEAMGEIYHIATNQSIQWGKVLDIYLDILENRLGYRPDVHWLNDSDVVARIFKNKYQICYDRLYNRKFDNRKIQEITHEEKKFVDVEDGLRECLSCFLDGDRTFLEINWKIEGKLDKLTNDYTALNTIGGWKNKLKYFLYRYIF